MLRILPLIFIFTLFFLKAFYMLDPDFGWHIKMGELILFSGIPATDPFSYTMSSFPFVDHEWGINILMRLIYENLGWVFMSALFALVTILVVLIPLGGSLKKYILLPFILAGGSFLFFAGIRPQVITWLFFSVLVTILLRKKYYEKFRLALPILFLFWANIHGGFPVGIAVYLLFLAIEFYEKRKLEKIDVVLFAISIFATLINPYGIRLWGEVWMQMSDSSLRWNIMEWKPAVFTFYPAVLGLFAFSFSFLLMFRKSFTLFEKALYFCLLLAGLSSVRHVPLWVIIASPILLKGLVLLGEKAGKIKYGRERFEKAYKFSFIMAIIFILIPVLSKRENPFLVNEENFYPKKAVNFLRENPSNGQVFSNYGWGGYLIWKYPEKKVFIDGRMPSWSWDKKIPGESTYVFKEYLSLSDVNAKFESSAVKYGIDTVLLPVPKESKESTDRLTIWLFGKFNKNKNEDIHKKLKREGWKVIYKDGVAQIYRR
ncbi:MAG: hypothetical protein ACD_37C00045G0007 [uncultured bacterium]|nr:MAG: hypothetical protein ACD_37C00045G0007 [uncultured bacterium]